MPVPPRPAPPLRADVSDESALATLRRLAPKLEAQLLLASKVALIEPLKELQALEGTDAALSAEYRAILGAAGGPWATGGHVGAGRLTASRAGRRGPSQTPRRR